MEEMCALANRSYNTECVAGLKTVGLLPEVLPGDQKRRREMVADAYATFCDRVRDQFSDHDRQSFSWSHMAADTALRSLYLLREEVWNLAPAGSVLMAVDDD